MADNLVGDDIGFQPAPQQSAPPPQDDGIGFQPLPKMPNTSGVQKMAQDNLAANDNAQPTESGPKPVQTPQERLNTVAGFPVDKVVADTAQPSDFNSRYRGCYVNALKDGSAVDGSDWMNTALHAIAPVVAGIGKTSIQAVKGFGEGFGKEPLGLDKEDTSDLEKIGVFGGPLDELNRAVIGTGATAMHTAMRTFSGAVGAGIGALDEAEKQTGFKEGANLLKEPLAYLEAGGGVELAGLHGNAALSGDYGLYKDGPIRDAVAKKNDIPPDATTPDHINQALHEGSKDIFPAAQDFKDVETVSGGALKEQTLHTIYVDTGVKPDQVFDDARHDPEIAAEASDGKIPTAYEHLEEPRQFAPQESEKLSVTKSETGTGFAVLDADGEHVRGGFDSAEEAQHFIEDRKFEAEERAAIESEKQTPATDKTAAGEQTVLPGAEKITDKALAERKMEEPLKGGNEAAGGLFGDEHKQTDLLDAKPQEAAKPSEVWATHEVKVAEKPKVAEPIEEPKLSKELSGAKPRYGYKDKQFTLKFDSDVDRAAYIAAQDVKKSKADSKYVDFLKHQGMDDKAIADLGAKVKEKIKTMAKDGKAGELSVSKTHELTKPEVAPIEKSQKPLSTNTAKPSEKGAPTSLSTFIKKNGKIKPDASDAGDLKSQGHTDLLSENGKPSDTMRELAANHGYDVGHMSVPEFHDLINDTDGGREHFRPQDADRVSASLERKLDKERNDPTRLEHEAEKAGVDATRLPNETDAKWTSRIKKALNDFYKNSEGAARARDINGKWLLKEPIETVEKWAGKLTGNIFQKIADGYKKTFQPELMGDKAKRLDSFLAKFKVAQEEARNTYFQQWRDEIKSWDKASSDERMQWLYDHETGRWDENDPAHATEQAMYDAMYEEEQKAGVGSQNFKENYLPHQWENPDAVAAHFKSDALVKKYGKDWFTKASVFNLIQEGVRAGFKLKTDNPARMRVARQLASDNMLRTMDLLHDMQDSGIATPTRSFSVDKRIAKAERQISELQERYKKEFDKANDSKQMTTEGTPPAESKMMKLVQSRMDDLRARLEDAKAEKSANKLTPEQMKPLKDGFKVIGPDNKAWNIHPEGGPIWKNVMDSKGLWEHEGVLGNVYRGWMGAKNAWIAAKLAASLFHVMHVAQIDLAGSISTAAHHLIQGGKISDLMSKESLPTLGLTKETLGLRDHPAIQAWNTPKEARTPEQQRLVTKMVEGGFKPTLSIQDTVHIKDNFDKAVSGLGANNLRLIGTAAQIPGMAMKPFMEHWIPGMKAAIYDHATELALSRDPSLKDDAGRRGEAFRQITKDVEHTYGEMNQDTLFWNKTIKDAFNAAYISGGWKLAQLYNLKGLAEPFQVASHYLKTGEFDKTNITYRMINAYTYTALTLATGGMVAQVLGQPIGKAWNEAEGVADYIGSILKDLIAPKTGDTNPDGAPIRVNQPAFAKEGYMLAREINLHGLIGGTGSFLYNGTLIPGAKETLSVGMGGLSDLLTGEKRPIGKDELGRTVIKDPTNLHEWMNTGWDAISPITLSTASRAEAKGSETAKVLGWMGFPMAGAYIDQTPFEQQVISKYFEQNPSDTSVYESKLKAEMKGAITNDSAEQQEKIEKQMEDDGMSEKDIAKSKHVYTDKFSDYAWSKLSPADQKILIESASEKEKAQFQIKGE